jgi:hypothetical protein
MNYFELLELKQHLNIESTYTADDLYLSGLTTVACTAIDTYCNYGLSGYTGTTSQTAIPVAVKHAAILFAGHLYLTRTIVSYTQAYEIPYTFKFLLDPYRNLTIT